MECPLQCCMEWMQAQGMPCVVVGDIRGFPVHIRGDVDVVLSRGGLRRLRSMLPQMASACGLRVVQSFQHEAGAFYYVLCRWNGSSLEVLRLDVCADYVRSARRYMSATELLEGRGTDSMNHPTSGLPIPDPAAAFRYYLTKKADKGILDSTANGYLRALWEQSPLRVRECLVTWLRLPLAQKVETALMDPAGELFQKVLPEVSCRLRRLHRRRWVDRFREIARCAGRVWHPTGLVVAFLGPDGSGKSSVLDLVEEALRPAFLLSRRLHFRPQFGRRLPGTGKVVSDPHNQQPRSFAACLLKLGYYALDYGWGGLRLFLNCTMRSGLVLFDRYAYDIEADPRRYRYNGPRWVLRLWGRLVPRPDLVFVLTGNSRTLWDRKREVPLETVSALCERYGSLAEREGWIRIDAGAPLLEVAARVEEAILSHLEHRLSRRAGWSVPASTGGVRTP